MTEERYLAVLYLQLMLDWTFKMLNQAENESTLGIGTIFKFLVPKTEPLCVFLAPEKDQLRVRNVKPYHSSLHHCYF